MFAFPVASIRAFQDADPVAQEAAAVAEELNEPVDVASLEGWVENGIGWLRDSAPNLLVKLLIFIFE